MAAAAIFCRDRTSSHRVSVRRRGDKGVQKMAASAVDLRAERSGMTHQLDRKAGSPQCLVRSGATRHVHSVVYVWTSVQV
jgi:hypothetical protein